MEFFYRAQKTDGQMESGILDAPDRFELARLVKERGATLIFTKPLDQPRRFSWLVGFTGRPSQKELMLFVGNLGTLLAAGLTLSRTLGLLARQAKKASFRAVIEGLARAIARGESLHVALGNYPVVFPRVLVAMVAAGEESGTLPETFKLASDQLAKSYELRRKIRGALIYPAVVIVVIIAIAALMMIFLVPTLAATFKDLRVELPLSTRLIIGISDWLVNFWWVALIGLAASIAFVLIWRRRPFGRRALDRLILVLPGFGFLAKEANTGLIVRTIASLIAAGVSMVETLRIAAAVAKNSFYQAALLSAVEEIQRGLTLSAILKKQEKLFPPLVGELAEVGEETGGLAAMLLRGAIFYENEVDQAVKNLSTIIEPVLMVLVGIAVGFFALAMIGPMYSLADVI